MGRPAVDRTGQRFGKLTVIKRAYEEEHQGDGHVFWLCRCDCGNYKVFSSGRFGGRSVKSCGCLPREMHLSHGQAETRLYNVWNNIKQRCLNENNKLYPDYGGRGITICDLWRENFEIFKEWAIANGYDENAKRGKCTIDRIDNDGNYEPTNCRITDMKVQSNNRRNTVYFDYLGERFTINQLSELLGIPRATIEDRHSDKRPMLNAAEEQRLYKILIGANETKGEKANAT